MGVSKNRGVSPKMDGENNGKTLLKWMIWGENPLFSETSISPFGSCPIGEFEAMQHPGPDDKLREKRKENLWIPGKSQENAVQKS